MPFDSTMCLATSNLTLICIIIGGKHAVRVPHRMELLLVVRVISNNGHGSRVFGLDFLRI